MRLMWLVGHLLRADHFQSCITVVDIALTTRNPENPTGREPSNPAASAAATATADGAATTGTTARR